jgi:spore coat polysaccharide biosynthesis predicted glycosyltransferase SpsG
MEINLICNGGVEIGIGHINRMINIYNEIKRRYNFPITFHIKGDFLKTINFNCFYFCVSARERMKRVNFFFPNYVRP